MRTISQPAKAAPWWVAFGGGLTNSDARARYRGSRGVRRLSRRFVAVQTTGATHDRRRDPDYAAASVWYRAPRFAAAMNSKAGAGVAARLSASRLAKLATAEPMTSDRSRPIDQWSCLVAGST